MIVAKLQQMTGIVDSNWCICCFKTLHSQLGVAYYKFVEVLVVSQIRSDKE